MCRLFGSLTLSDQVLLRLFNVTSGLTITMPRVLHKKLKKIADDRDSSMNILVNTALAHWLAKKGALRLG